MEYKIKYVKTEVKKIYKGLVEGRFFVNTYWNGGIDSSLEAELEYPITTIGIEQNGNIEFYEFIDLGNYYNDNTIDSAVELKKENYDKIYKLINEGW